jgi:hypothetical protein
MCPSRPITAFLIFLSVFPLPAVEAVIKETSGAVELKPPGTDTWIPARAGDPVRAATVISTGFKSTAILTIGNSTVSVRPLTRMSLEEFLELDNTETVNIQLRAGRVRAEVLPPPGGKTSFTVSSPMAVASVRGTVFEFDTARLRVSGGIIAFEPRDSRPRARRRQALVRGGQSSWVDSETQAVWDPVLAAEAERSFPALPGEEAKPPARRLSSNTASITASIVVDFVFVP